MWGGGGKVIFHIIKGLLLRGNGADEQIWYFRNTFLFSSHPSLPLSPISLICPSHNFPITVSLSPIPLFFNRFTSISIFHITFFLIFIHSYLLLSLYLYISCPSIIPPLVLYLSFSALYLSMYLFSLFRHFSISLPISFIPLNHPTSLHLSFIPFNLPSLPLYLSSYHPY